MEILDYILTVSYFLGIIAAGLGVVRYILEFKKDKKFFRLFGASSLICLIFVFLGIIVNMGSNPILPVFMMKIIIRSSVVGFAAFKFSFELFHLLSFVSVGHKDELTET